MPHFATYQPFESALRPPDDLVVGLAEQRHADGIAALYSAREGVAAEVGTTWTQRVLSRMGESSFLVVAESGGRVVGYGLVAWLEPETTPEGFYLLGVVVDPSFGRKGIGHAMTRMRMDWIRERADQAFYFANVANEATIDLHEQFGFREVRRQSEIAGVTFDGGTGTGVLYQAVLSAETRD